MSTHTIYTCDHCGATATSDHKDYVPDGWRSYAWLTASKQPTSVIVGTYRYWALEYHFCSFECAEAWVAQKEQGGVNNGN